jgi:RNA polymerase sigma-70 factor (ECF subfamily)
VARRPDQREKCAAIVAAHYEKVYRFLAQLARDAAQAEDLTQETFAAAWQSLDTFEGRSSVGTWLHRIAYGKFIDARRAAARRAALSKRFAEDQPSQREHGPLELAEARDEVRRVHEALGRLEEAERTLLVLHYLQGLSYQEMTDILDEPSGTVKWRTSQALARLRDVLSVEAEHERSRAAH